MQIGVVKASLCLLA